MGTPTTPNVERQGNGSVLIEAEDDDPGIRGLSQYTSSSSPSHRHQFASQLKTNPTADPLDAAIIDQSGVSSGSAALKLDQFVLGKTELAPDVALGSLSTSGSAISTLKGVASLDRSRYNSSHPRKPMQDYLSVESDRHSPRTSSSTAGSTQSNALPIPQQDSSQYMAGSPSGLTWSSSSPTSSSSLSSNDSVEAAVPKYFSDNVYRLPIKRMIKQVCVAGLEPRKSSRKFCLTIEEIRNVCSLARDMFLEEPTMLRLDAPVKIVGDIHGQFRDLMRLFKKGGMPPSQHYLFLGDYVDRGKQSLETIMLLLLLKLRYPSHIHLLRGNHECASVTKVYGFYDECKRRSSVKSWRAVVDVFNSLPVAAVVGGRIFCVHGGISPGLNSFSQIEAIQRPTDVPEQGILADLLWSDPDPQVKEWSENDRGVSFCFGQRSLDRFCKQLSIDLVVRGHMVVEDGFEFFGGRRLVTVFSASNYCGDFDNYGAMMSVSEGLVCSFDTIEPKVRSPKKKSSPSAESDSSTSHHEMNKRPIHKNKQQNPVFA